MGLELADQVGAVPGKYDLTAGPSLDLELVLTSHFFMGFTRCVIEGGRSHAAFHLLAEKQVIKVHGESPCLGAGSIRIRNLNAT